MIWSCTSSFCPSEEIQTRNNQINIKTKTKKITDQRRRTKDQGRTHQNDPFPYDHEIDFTAESNE